MRRLVVRALVCFFFGLVGGMLIVSALHAAPAPTPAPVPEAETEDYLIISVEMWNKVERALAYWFEEAQRLKQSKGCA